MVYKQAWIVFVICDKILMHNTQEVAVRQCPSCDETKEDSCFYELKKDKRCKECHSKKNKEWSAKNRERVRAAHKKWRADNLDHAKKYAKEWRAKNSDRIKAEQKIRSRAWYLANKDRASKASRGHELKKFWPGLKAAEALIKYEEMRLLQNGQCLICKVHDSELRVSLNVDHCHDTGKVRGLLCGNCNRGLGLFKSRRDLLESASLYLERNQS